MSFCLNNIICNGIIEFSHAQAKCSLVFLKNSVIIKEGDSNFFLFSKAFG